MDTLLSLAIVAGFFLAFALMLGCVLWLNRFRDGSPPRPHAARVQPRVEREAVRNRHGSPRIQSALQHPHPGPSSDVVPRQLLLHNDHDMAVVPIVGDGAGGGSRTHTG